MATKAKGHSRPRRSGHDASPRAAQYDVSDATFRRHLAGRLAAQNTKPAGWTDADTEAVLEETQRQDDAELAERQRLDDRSIASRAAQGASAVQGAVTSNKALSHPLSAGWGSLRSSLSGDGPGHSMLGFLFGMALYAAFINFLHGGKAAVYAWFKAKFLNETPAQSASPIALADLVTVPGASAAQGADQPPPTDAAGTSAPPSSPPPAPSATASPIQHVLA